MKILLILGCLVGLALAADLDDFKQELQEDIVDQKDQDSGDIETYYHASIGIPMAEMMREYEEAMLRRDKGQKVDERIIGGQVINDAGVIPYIGGIIILLTDGNISMCGSSLLSNTRSLTAAHCWYDGEHQAKTFTLVHGSPTIYYGGVRTRTSDVTTHEDWDYVSNKNDVAIIRHSSIEFNSSISSIPLPRGELQKKDFLNIMVEAAGYGLNGTDNSSMLIWQQPLRVVKVQVIDNKKCSGYFGSNVYPSSICTRNGPRTKPLGTCGGDSGGPLTVEEDGKKYLIGVTSYGHEICEKWPSVYSRVTAFIDWIDGKM